MAMTREVMWMADVVYVVTYFSQAPEDGFELGGVYSRHQSAEDAAKSRECASYDWEHYEITERVIDGGVS